MKRFKIRNNRNGLEFQIEQEELGAIQPEWGAPDEFTITEEDITTEVAAKKAAEEAQIAKIEKIKNLKKADVDTVAKLSQAILDLRDVVAKLI
jgi:hypothetical protein